MTDEMEKLDAMETLTRLPYDGLTKIGNLVEYDGPLLAEYRTTENEPILVIWCDCDSDHHRWMYVKINEPDLVSLKLRQLSLDSIVPERCDNPVAFVDVTSNELLKTYFVEKHKIPLTYLPKEGSFIDVEVNN